MGASAYRRIDRRVLQAALSCFCDSDPYILVKDDGGVSIFVPARGPDVPSQQLHIPLRRNLRELAWQLKVIADELEHGTVLVPWTEGNDDG